MLGLLLLYWIGKHFYKLAENYNRHAWGHAIMGIVCYYLGTFVGGLALIIIIEMINPGGTDTLDDYALGLMGVPFGLLSLWLLSRYLNRRYAHRVEHDITETEYLDDHL